MCLYTQVLNRTQAPALGAGRDVWLRVWPVAVGYIVNIGDMLERWTGGFLKSTVHRVVNPSVEGAATTPHRYSSPFFIEVWPPTTWTALQKDDPNHLELRCKALPEHQMALITSGLCPSARPDNRHRDRCD